MSLSVFIRRHHPEIIREFVALAKTLMPQGGVMSDAELGEHAEEMLTAIEHDLSTAQAVDEQSKTSQGRGVAHLMAAAGARHADLRVEHGYSRQVVLAEFRALRATVLRRYAGRGESDGEEWVRFNDAVDQALTESMARFTARSHLLQDRLIGILSHDLRSPLAAITTGAALLAVAEDHPQRRVGVVATIITSAQRMERMIGDLLDFTQARLAGVIPITRGHADLHRVCEQVIREARMAHPDVVLRCDTRGDLVGAWDADRLAQVVSNLVGNAIQHGAGTPVTLTARDDGKRATLAVHNGGAPIPRHVWPIIFQPLARGQVEPDTHSIGFGLFIARAIVSAHGGRIDVRSSHDEGTTFTVWLPKGALP